MDPCRDAIRIAPSLLAADFGRIAEAAQALEHTGADRIHVDVMDGVFVPNFTFGTDTVRVLRRATSLPLELHLMIVNPDKHLGTFATAGADAITVHYEACPHLHRTLTSIRALDCRSGAAINPSTPALMLDDVLEACDLALVMTIDPGFGGQQLIPHTLLKVEQLRREIERQGLDDRGRGRRRRRRGQREGVRRRRSRRARRRHRRLQARGWPGGGDRGAAARPDECGSVA